MLIRPETAAVKREIPHEPGESVTIRPLTGVELDEARQVTTDKAMATVRALPQEMLNSLPKATEGDRETEPDAATLIAKGLIGWSYPDPVEAGTVALLDAKTRDWLAGEIKALCVRDAASVKGSSAA
jgi:hypothetical protein